jgi:septal ring factor EnvC (AmiA/AmiB activator)
MPLEGGLVAAFGDETQAGYQYRGIAILTSLGMRVGAPSAGQVVYADAFRAHGQLVIINAGDGYSLLLGGLAKSASRPANSSLRQQALAHLGHAPRAAARH